MGHRLNIATGQSRFQKRWKNEDATWAELAERLRTPVVTAETVAEYRKLPPQKQTDVKDVGGFVGGYLTEGLRKAQNVYSRSVVTLDYDEFSEERLNDLRNAMGRLGSPAWLVHSTHKHTVRAWRVRVVMPLKRSVSADEYGAIARKVAVEIGFGGIDRSTFEPCRLMFWPSRSKDGDWLCEEGEGAELDPDTVLRTYTDWRDMSAWPLLPEEDLSGLFGERDGGLQIRKGAAEDTVGRMAGRQEDPRQKKGLVGAFCRAYTIGEAIERFIPSVYSRSGRGRWTHTGSTTTGGAWELEEGRFLYSFHGTDPLQGRLLNSWDLVRLVMYGDLDSPEERRKPSERKMEQLALDDPKVKTLLMEERKAAAMEAFATVEVGEERQEGEKAKEGKEKQEGKGLDPEWEEWNLLRGSALKVRKDGTTVTDAASLMLVLTKHPDIKDAIRYNDFSGMIEVCGRLPWRHVGDYWNNMDDASLRVWLDRELGMSGKEKIGDAVDALANERGYHPVMEYLDSLEWDGMRRCATVLTHVLGAEDTRLNRVLTELFFTGAVRRIKKPGCKYDYILTLQGVEGTGKSSFFSILGGIWFSDSPLNLDNKDGMASLQGVWIYEMAELNSIRKKDVESVKSFISSQTDKFRPAFARRFEERPRQCVFGATTNEDYFLRGIYNENRRQVVVRIDPKLRKVTEPVREWLERWRDQLWAEAVVMEREGRPLVLPVELQQEAKEVQKEFNLDLNNTLFPEIDRYLDLALPGSWDDWTTMQRIDHLRKTSDNETEIHDYFGYARRQTVTVPEILQELMEMRKTDKDYQTRGREVGRYLNTRSDWKVLGIRKTKLYGKQKTWERVGDMPQSRDILDQL